jgi:hypothetical protein
VKKLFASLLVALSLSGVFVMAPAAHADDLVARVRATITNSPVPCIRVNVTLFGTRIGTGSTPICL